MFAVLHLDAFPGCHWNHPRYLHSAGIYHRDLKPANCLVNQDCHLFGGLPFFLTLEIPGWIIRLVYVCPKVADINLRLSYMLKQKTWGMADVLLLPTRTAPSRFATSGCHSFNGHFWLKRRRMLGALYPQHFVSGNMNDLNKRWFEVGYKVPDSFDMQPDIGIGKS